jgi:DNA-binding beta-propeller fold protein YncE/mono/diheme cytochrome c family protein
VIFRRAVSLALAVVLLAIAGSSWAQPSFIGFESGLVRPLALSPNGAHLFAVNTPNNRLEIFYVDTSGGLTALSTLAVGLEPVSVAARSSSEVWVVNHLSDSVTIVDVSMPASPRVVRTLLVGDEPRDIVFAGSPDRRAFITTAHRGQHRTHASIAGTPGAGDPQFTTAGVNRADVWVFDPDALGSTLGGTPLRIVTLFGDTPRPLAVSPDGNTVYAGVFHSGNRTSVVSEGRVCNGFGVTPCNGDNITSPNGLAGGQLPGGLPGPSTNVQGITAPEVGLIVKFHSPSGQWQDHLGRNWSNGVRFFLPDKDVFAIDANTLTETTNHPGVGTTLFNMVTNPVNGNVYVSNTEARNLTRFEGPGIHGGSTVQGNLAQSRITVITPGGAVKPRHLNRHIDYSMLPAPPAVKAASLATPVEMVVSPDGARLYVAAFGSSKIGVFATADLENDALWDGIGPEFDPVAASADYIGVSGGGPAGLLLNAAKNRLYTLTRFNNAVVTVNTTTGTELASQPLSHNPEPASVVNGRSMLYDAVRTSSNGEASCSSCHIFGDLDHLAWDLGNPDDPVTTNPMPIHLLVAAGDQNGGASNTEFHPMKGPMTTQTLRGLANSGAMHWRGDRADGFFGTDPPGGKGSETLSFDNFIVAFEGLLGLDEPPTDLQLQADMQAFTDFALQLILPPNPVRNLDNSLTADQQAGANFYSGSRCSDGLCFLGVNSGVGFNCNGCHTLNPAQGFFGTGGIASFENETQIFKIAHLRNMYQKVGMFGMPGISFFNPGDNGHKGDQVRGFGFLHDGSTDTMFRFFQATVFNSGTNVGFQNDTARRQMEQFMLAFPSDLAPVVGQQVTDYGAPIPDTAMRVNLLRTRAGAPFNSKVLGGAVTECDLIVKGVVGGLPRGWLYVPGTSRYRSDRASELPYDQADLDAIADGGASLTYTCAPPGSGVRMGIDEDLDGVLDADERDAGTQPSNPGSLPGACNDGIDNDGDGLIDLADPGCRNSEWNIENPQCNDGVNNDADGLVDLADPHCTAAWVKSERTSSCGLGAEVAFLLPALAAWRYRRRRC